MFLTCHQIKIIVIVHENYRISFDAWVIRPVLENRLAYATSIKNHKYKEQPYEKQNVNIYHLIIVNCLQKKCD